MSARLETALARLYSDDIGWQLFEGNTDGFCAQHRLNEEEKRALLAVDREALRMARHSFQAKRAHEPRPKRPVLPRLRRWLRV